MMQYSLKALLLFIAVVVVFARPPGQIDTKFGGGMKKGESNRIDRIWKTTQSNCEKKDCGTLVPEEAYNCVNKCVSSACYEEVYGDNPLEDGEIDSVRNRKFVGCVRQEVRAQKYGKR